MAALVLRPRVQPTRYCGVLTLHIALSAGITPAGNPSRGPPPVRSRGGRPKKRLCSFYTPVIEHRQGLKIAGLEVVAYCIGMIATTQFRELTAEWAVGSWGGYLQDLLRDFLESLGQGQNAIQE